MLLELIKKINQLDAEGYKQCSDLNKIRWREFQMYQPLWTTRKIMYYFIVVVTALLGNNSTPQLWILSHNSFWLFITFSLHASSLLLISTGSNSVAMKKKNSFFFLVLFSVVTQLDRLWFHPRDLNLASHHLVAVRRQSGVVLCTNIQCSCVKKYYLNAMSEFSPYSQHRALYCTVVIL